MTTGANDTGRGETRVGDRRVCVAIIGAPHGIRGEIRVRSYTADPLDVAAYGPLETEDRRQLKIRTVRPAKGVVIATFEGVTDRNAAEALKNIRLYIDRERMPEPAEDEWYYDDLVGLSVEATDGTEIGTVTTVQDFGGGDLLELTLKGSRDTVFVPFTKAAVPVIDAAGRRLVIDPPPGLFDEDEPSDRDRQMDNSEDQQ